MVNPNVSVDCVVFGFDGRGLNVLLIEQKDVGQRIRLALPGDLVLDEESLDEAAQRVLRDLTALEGVYLHRSGQPSKGKQGTSGGGVCRVVIRLV